MTTRPRTETRTVTPIMTVVLLSSAFTGGVPTMTMAVLSATRDNPSPLSSSYMFGVTPVPAAYYEGESFDKSHDISRRMDSNLDGCAVGRCDEPN